MKILIIECYIAFMAVISYLNKGDFSSIEMSIWTAAVMLAWLMRLRSGDK